jgi:hypothetical protein
MKVYSTQSCRQDKNIILEGHFDKKNKACFGFILPQKHHQKADENAVVAKSTKHHFNYCRLLDWQTSLLANLWTHKVVNA